MLFASIFVCLYISASGNIPFTFASIVCFCVSFNASASVLFSLVCTLTGTVLIKRPTVFSIFLSGILLPDIILSQITSSLPEYFCNAIPNAHSNTEFAVTLFSLATFSIFFAASSLTGVVNVIIFSFLILSFFSLPYICEASLSARRFCQYSVTASVSCFFIQFAYSAYEVFSSASFLSSALNSSALFPFASSLQNLCKSLIITGKHHPSIMIWCECITINLVSVNSTTVTLNNESFCKSRAVFKSFSTIASRTSFEYGMFCWSTVNAGFLFSNTTCLIAPVDLSTVNADLSTSCLTESISTLFRSISISAALFIFVTFCN